MRRARGGFTLVEALVAGGVFLVVLSTLFLAFFAGTDTVRRGMEVLDVSAGAGLALEHLRRDLRALAGDVPVPLYASPGELTLQFARLESADPERGTGRVSTVRYRLVTSRDRTRTLLAREVDGAATRLLFEREVVLLVGTGAGVPDGERAVALELSFPEGGGRSGRPAVRTLVRVLNRDPLLPVPGADDRVAVALPRGDRPFSAGPGVRSTDAAAIFPEGAWPRKAAD